MAAIAGHRLTLDPMGKCSNAFFSETTNMIKAKLYMNVHWMFLYKLYVFCSDMKFKMAAMAGLSLTLDPMFFMPIGNLRWLPPQDIDYVLRENVQMPSSQKLPILLKPSCTRMFNGWSSTNFTFFVPI